MRENPQINSIWSEKWYIIIDVANIKKMEEDIMNNCMPVYLNEMEKAQKTTKLAQKK